MRNDGRCTPPCSRIACCWAATRTTWVTCNVRTLLWQAQVAESSDPPPMRRLRAYLTATARAAFNAHAAPLPLKFSVSDPCTYAKQPWYAVQRLVVAVQQQAAMPQPEAMLTAATPGCAVRDATRVWCHSCSTTSNTRDTITYALELLSSGSCASPEPLLISSASIPTGTVNEGAAEAVCNLAEMATPPMTPGRQQLVSVSCPQAPIRRRPSVELVPASEMSKFMPHILS